MEQNQSVHLAADLLSKGWRLIIDSVGLPSPIHNVQNGSRRAQSESHRIRLSKVPNSSDVYGSPMNQMNLFKTPPKHHQKPKQNQK